MGSILDRGFSFRNYTDNSITGLLRTGQGVLHTITINTSPSGTGSLEVYDGVDNTGTPIATITLTQAAGVDFVPTTLLFDALFTTGLFLEVDAQDLTGYDFTITYK